MITNQSYKLLTPMRIGPETYEVSEALGAKAVIGTGFNPDNPQHRFASDAVRYAIAIQQLREAGDYAAVDAARAFVEMTGAKVMQSRDGTTIKTLPFGYESLSATERKAFRLDSYPMPIRDGLIFDPSVHITFWGEIVEPPRSVRRA